MKPKYFLLLITVLLALASCRKFLDAKPDKQLAVPQSLKDCQALLDNTNTMTVQYPTAGEIAADNFYLLYTSWQSRSVTDQNTYIWSRDVFNDNDRNDWNNSYSVVYYANTVLDLLKNSFTILSGPQEDNIKGQALMFRSFAFYNLLQLFAKPYDEATASVDLGIPLRLNPDLNVPSVRASVKECYDQLIADAKEAARLLPVTPLVKTRPSRTAAFALLARTYLSMADYNNAFIYADSALNLYNTLMDFNCSCINLNAANPFARYNNEVIFHTLLFGSGTLSTTTAKVDSNLYSSYNANDLRKTGFFKNNNNGTYGFKGSYNGSSANFCGLATDELYLIRSECNVRLNRLTQGLNDLNTLLSKRWKAAAFVPVSVSDPDQALQIILDERRKELLYRGLRWSDLRRLNKDPRFAVTLTRNLNGQLYILPPNDKRYVFPIPVNVIQITGMPQN
ncbi:MAG TPA: RagB/SusD family nutrient uptake outer membrane protein [Chitinophagaceae bacterium]|nr:RagB/SusD family nutrient uptake outer membrane protein [Chitinophagaceae bacterium]